MKTLKRIIYSLFIAIFAFLLVGCKEKPVEKTFTDISIDISSVKQEFIIGEEFTSEGIKVYAVYDDESTKEVSNYSLSSSDYKSNQVGEYEIVIKYSFGGKLYEKSYKVNVIKDPNRVIVNSITLNTDNVKLDYILGDNLDLSALVVTANYSNNTSKQVTNYTVDDSSFNGGRVGTYRILISYIEDDEEVVAILTVNVKDILSTVNYLIGIEVTPRNEYFLKGTEYSSENVKVLAVYQDGTKVDVTAKANINSSKYNKDVIGVYEIIIDYQEKYGEGEYAVTIFWDSFYFARVVDTLPEGGE